MSFRDRVKPGMDVEEFCSIEFIDKVRDAVKTMLDILEFQDGFIKDRLLTELTREICLSRM